MEHRRFLACSQVHRAFIGSDVLRRIGGLAAIEALVDGLYDRIATDVALRPFFSRDLANERVAQKRFFAEWLGGESRYSDSAYMPLKHRHDLLPITRAHAERWLAHFRDALASAVPAPEQRRTIQDRVSILATALVNEGEEPSALRARSHGTCLRYKPAVEALTLARRGDVTALRRLLHDAPSILASAPLGARLLQLAVLGGNERGVELLLDTGVDVNKPSPIGPMERLIFTTPLCAARAKRRTRIEALLLGRGALDDIFTHAFLGELDRLREVVGRDPAMAQAIDPATDVLEITPVHHAVAGGQVEALRALLAGASQTNEPLRGGARAVRDAAMREDAGMVALLLAHGASARSIGAGRWVLHPELASMLARAGASVDRSGAWIGAACTGNQGRKDDPHYVAALLRHGARVEDKRLVGQGNGRATALHYAAKAGFVKTIEVLLDHGADLTARDDNGLTALDWLERAAPSVDRRAVRRLLQRRS